MKHPIGTMLLAVTAACLAEGMVFEPPSVTTEETRTGDETIVKRTEDSLIASGLKEFRNASRQR
mgnify:CR=1 FL=1